MVVRGGRRYSAPPPTPFYSRSGQIFNDDVNDFSSISNIYFMIRFRPSVSDTDSLIPDPDPAF